MGSVSTVVFVIIFIMILKILNLFLMSFDNINEQLSRAVLLLVYYNYFSEIPEVHMTEEAVC